MAIKVKHRSTGKIYILLGTGLGAYKATRPGLFFGNLLPEEESGTLERAAVCDESGNIGWCPTTELCVYEIDGKKIEELF
ncbi:MAG: hypothetical protein MJB12_12685 [Firmicutes bacterium]|nr:hypothetical protein [Bacillota bacterium]